MLSKFSRIGEFHSKIESGISFYLLDKELKLSAKKIQVNDLDDLEVVNYVLEKDFWGPKEIVIVTHKADYVKSIILKSKKADEFNELLSHIENMFPLIQLVGEKNNMRMYSIHNSDIHIMVGKGGLLMHEYMVGVTKL